MREIVVPARNIVIGQRVNRRKQALAKQYRRSLTVDERLLWQALRGNRLGGLHFRRQQVIDGYIVDFYCHAAALVVEVDGGVHEEQAAEDARRDAALARRGLRVLRLRNEDVRWNLSGVLERILAEAKGELSAPEAQAGRTTPRVR